MTEPIEPIIELLGKLDSFQLPNHPHFSFHPGFGFELPRRDGEASGALIVLVTRDMVHMHHKTKEIYICLQGEGLLYKNGEPLQFIPGDSAIIPPGTVHYAEPNGSEPLVFLCISEPSYDPNDFEDMLISQE